MKSALEQFTVSQLAEQAGVTADAVRYYTRIDLLRPTRNYDNRYRLYDHRDLLRLKFIHRAKTLGFTIKDIRAILHESEKGKSPCHQVRSIIERNIRKNKQRLSEAMELQRRMEKALYVWQKLPDGTPVGDSICHLIESVT